MRRAFPRRIGIVLACALVAGSVASWAPASAAPTSQPALGPPIIQRTFSDTTADGYKLRATFRVYPLVHAADIPALPYDHRASLSCPVDPTADAAIPVAFTLTNITARKRIGLGVVVDLTDFPARLISSIEFDGMLSNKPFCRTTTAADAISYVALWNKAHATGEGERADFYVIIPGYYTGERSLLHGLYLDIFLYANGHVPGHNRFRTSGPPHDWLVHLGR